MARRKEVMGVPPGFEGRIVGVVGTKDTGKTRVVEALVKYLRRKGFSVATVKHVHGKAAFEPVTSDSARHLAAGASTAVAISADSIFLTAGPTPAGAADAFTRACAQYLAAFDYVIVEGFKHVTIPKIVVTRSPGDIPRNLTHVVAYVYFGPRPPKGLRLPVFAKNERAKLGRFLLKSGILAEPAARIHLSVNDTPIPMNEFVRSALTGVLEGFITRLRDIAPAEKIELTASNLRKK
jgi:molybdopterin-guanine dinucleotide biosynthesis protein B